jgi:hypothetical protein
MFRPTERIRAEKTSIAQPIGCSVAFPVAMPTCGS